MDNILIPNLFQHVLRGGLLLGTPGSATDISLLQKHGLKPEDIVS